MKDMCETEPLNDNLTALDIYDILKRWLDWSFLSDIKDRVTFQELSKRYWLSGKEYKDLREDLHFLIAMDPILYKDVKALAKKDFLFDILIDGWSYDKNKTEQGEDPVLPFIPFPHQLELINLLQSSKKHLHIEKSRRQGVSVIMDLYRMWRVKHNRNLEIIVTHKDANSLDMGATDKAKNSVFERLRWLTDMSIFTPTAWRDRSIYWVDENAKKNIKKYHEFFTKENQITIFGNLIQGALLGKGTNVGNASDEFHGDEVDVRCDMFPNLAWKMMQGVTTSVDRVILYSTYRSKDYPFFGYKRTNDTQRWDFVRLHWRDNPTCNADWYNDQRSRLDYDDVMVARELDINPNKAREGVVFKGISEDHNRAVIPKGIFRGSKWTKVIGADFGGGHSSTVFIFAYFNTHTEKLFLVDMIKTTDMEAWEIVKYTKDIGFNNVPVFGDRSMTAQTSTPLYSWYKMLSDEGMKMLPIKNTSAYRTFAAINRAFKEENIIVAKDQEIMWDDIVMASYDKNDQIKKDTHSHTADALMFLWRGMFEKEVIALH